MIKDIMAWVEENGDQSPLLMVVKAIRKLV